MMKQILVLNSGSSSIKYKLFDMIARTAVITGSVERIGETGAQLRQTPPSRNEAQLEQPIPDHQAGMKLIVDALRDSLSVESNLIGIGHRVVHGGEEFKSASVIDERVISSIRRLIPLAPLHNEANLLGIEVARACFPKVAQVAVFDTAFHQTIPERAYLYALPRELYHKHRIRRYGFHGTSHQSAVHAAADYLGQDPKSLNLIVCHLGNGASATAVQEGQSIDTSMGLTPLEGLVMGTRSGDIDPAIVFHLIREAKMTPDEVEELLNRKSGLKGICGANDMREITRRAADGDSDADRAMDLSAYRLKKYIGAYLTVLGRIDGLVFTAGIGENSSEIRRRVCTGMEHLGIRLAPDKNQDSSRSTREIQTDESAVKVLVVPCNEELEIADQTLQCVGELPQPSNDYLS